MIKAGDTVKHIPTGETWLLGAVDQDRKEGYPQGWPETCVKLSDCELVHSATEAESWETIMAWVKNHPGSSDMRYHINRYHVTIARKKVKEDFDKGELNIAKGIEGLVALGLTTASARGDLGVTNDGRILFSVQFNMLLTVEEVQGMRDRAANSAQELKVWVEDVCTIALTDDN